MGYLEQLKKESKFIQVLEVLMWSFVVFIIGAVLAVALVG